ncbi:tRNA (5-methylaminomethyl-2-thiouridine)(34)-methyltransferase MnmD [Labrenzia sp. DG1229]|uniref:tRNA (5-methylaminomethyl-2-thiouridine)(34)-methyltransferase MnmD n=1 Tax=Labrenzia sp. DG1229 TaxID=681847 RepID=UPI00068FEB12|nr:tRNA (5-methylaminomethyl-2-thiouridine)(34)-methyltransferase MnmD [Labrenzia sp. DG1229]
MTEQDPKLKDASRVPSSAPDLKWLEGEVPLAQGFDDTYFSRAGGMEETRHVFLNGNGLPERFEGRQAFTIAEFGFGTGLNFLTTLATLDGMSRPPGLQFISFELFPMTACQLERALAAFPVLAEVSAELISKWAPKPGWNRMSVSNADLLLGVGDARDLIEELVVESGPVSVDGMVIAPVDAWYLDGFSPAKNPELWDADLLASAATLTACDGTLASYTAAGWVRRNLQSAGFAIEKKAGFAGKREMVAGRKS